ncbi:TonB-dependent receptor [Pseudoalteromonas phenolica]|uniref:TonB-dependent receptor n=1 Tax=Pseudoalteromonas phenolica TaxID=161398 RepID=A0A4Q7IU35_9GAMM|nr:TonB-dependent receptor [Pseudoalteromonas phenolica]RZQ54767.1 TonB-dependent receptor [Pseudoalteromonas phenolica]
MLNNKVSKAVRLALAFGAASSAVFTASSFANDEDGAEAVERIEVTGSRIRKAEYTSNAPVASVDSEQFVLTKTVNTESLLNTLPQVVPGLDRTSNNPGNGTATVNLRGLGSNRTLVLINGTRAVPTSSSGVVDINSIPTALIQNVEVLTGGASAVYGSDAVAGVVNFILKKDFEGINTNVGYEQTAEGDAGIFNADFTIGGNFAEDKGNIVFNVAYTKRDDAFQGDRDFSSVALFDDGNGGLEPGGSSGVPGTAIFNGGFSSYSDSAGVIFGQDGSVRPFVAGGDVNDFYNYAPVNYMQLPQERTQFSTIARYELSDNAELYGRAMFTDSYVPSQLAPTPIFQTSEFTLDGSPFITPEAQKVISDAIGVTDEDGNLIDSDGDGIADTASALVRRRLEEVGPRRSESTFTSYQYQFGVKGFIGDSVWGYDAYYQKGTTRNSEAQLGNVNRGRFNQALLLDLSDPTGNTCKDPSSSGSTTACAPINIFGEGNISEAGAAYLRTAVNSSSVYTQEMIGLNFSGDSSDFFELPGGAVGISVGYEKRDEDFEFLPSQDLASGDIAGFNGAPPVSGGFDVSSFNAELYFPIFVGEDWADLLDLELAYRTADYSTVGSVSSYKVAGSYAPIEEVRFRVGYNTAVRAPNISELFSPQSEGFPGATDPCSEQGTDKSSAVGAICTGTGVPNNVLFNPAINLPAGQVRAISGGNPELMEEEATTLTVGLVFTPSDDISFGIDYFDIQIDDVIASFGGGANNILATCYDPSSAKGGLGSVYCDTIKRRGDGTIESVLTLSQNIAKVTLKGVDVAANYSFEALGGDIAVDYMGTFTTESNSFPEVGEDPIECAGMFGQDCGEPTPKYKHRMTFKWSNDDITAQLMWRHVGKVNDDDDDTDYTVEEISGFNYFGLSGSYSFAENYNVTLGIRNLFDKTPPVIGGNDEQANTYPATYDIFGRTYSLSFNASF